MFFQVYYDFHPNERKAPLSFQEVYEKIIAEDGNDFTSFKSPSFPYGTLKGRKPTVFLLNERPKQK